MARYDGRTPHYYLASETDRRDRCGAAQQRTIFRTLSPGEPHGGQWVGVSFSCTGSWRVKRGQPVIGVFSRAKLSPTPADRAWRIDLRKRRFVRVRGLACSHFD